MQFLVDILPLGFVDPHIFADPDPGSLNLADPDPEHCLQKIAFISINEDDFYFSFFLQAFSNHKFKRK